MGFRYRSRIICATAGLDTQHQFENVRSSVIHLIDCEGQQRIVEHVDRFRPDIVVLDPWQELICGYDELSGKDMSIARHFVQELIDRFNVTVFFVMHEGKDPSKGGRGHSGVNGWRDTLIRLKRTGEHVTVNVEPRWGSELKLDLEFMKDEGVLTSTHETLFTRDQKKLREFLATKPDGATIEEIREKFEKKKGATKKMVDRAVAVGAVVPADGRYVAVKTVLDSIMTKDEL